MSFADEAKRIADLRDLDNPYEFANFFDLNGSDQLAAGIGYCSFMAKLRYTNCITGLRVPFNKCFTSLAAGQPIPSSSSIMPEITDSPPSQNLGSLASSPNGLSSSE